MSRQSYALLETRGGVPVKAWVCGVPVEPATLQQAKNIARLPFIHRWVALMPDAHLGKGATVGGVIPTERAIIPAAVGVDIGCGMVAARTSLTASQLPDTLRGVRHSIEAAVPHGRTGGGRSDKGAWSREPPEPARRSWAALEPGFLAITDKHRALKKTNNARHLGTLGTGNHFIEVCTDESQRVWFMLHSGSRGVGNAIGRYFIELAKRDMGDRLGQLPDKELAYLQEGSRHFDDYVEAVGWAQGYARANRRVMMENLVARIQADGSLPPFTLTDEAINCHHNYVERERHYGREVWVTRKGAVRAGLGELGIIPGSMGARSYIVRGRGNRESFCSCSHGAGRTMSRTQARRRFSVKDHIAATAGVECRKDKDVLDETPGAYKDIDAVMRAQEDLVEVVHALKQVVCVKG